MTFWADQLLILDESRKEKGLFKCASLNRCVIQKHILRNYEKRFFNDESTIATKIMIPLDYTNLHSGWRVIFIGQIKWLDALIEDAGFNIEEHKSDIDILAALDEAPSFDPFLLRESLIRAGSAFDANLFKLSAEEVSKMEEFVYSEVVDLVTSALEDPNSQSARADTMVLVKKILGKSADSSMDEFRLLLSLELAEFEFGMFSWRGFLYYKWMSRVMRPHIVRMIEDISAIVGSRFFEKSSLETAKYKSKLFSKNLMKYFNDVVGLINNYNKHSQNIRQGAGRSGFRGLIVDAPDMFLILGTKMGILSQVIDAWQQADLVKHRGPGVAENFVRVLCELTEIIELSDPDNSYQRP